jgi:transposase
MLSALIRGGVEMAALAITRTDMSAADLRAAAKRSRDAKQASRILAIAMVLDGFSREEAARLCGMDRQTLRDWVHRYNKAGLGGLADLSRSGRSACLSWVEQGKVASWVEEGADLARDGVVRFRRADLRDRIAAEFGVELHERSVGKLLRRLDFRHLSVRPQHPQSDPAAQEAFKKLRGLSKRGAWRARRWQAGRGLVPGRSKGWPARHADPHLGQARKPPARAARPALQLGVSVRCGLPGPWRWQRFGLAHRQHRSHEQAPG